jgi:hypothetical protein
MISRSAYLEAESKFTAKEELNNVPQNYLVTILHPSPCSVVMKPSMLVGVTKRYSPPLSLKTTATLLETARNAFAPFFNLNQPKL